MRVLFLLFGAAYAGLAQIPTSTLKLLDYDAAAPLRLTQRPLETTAEARVFDIEYDSPRGGRVTAYVVEPVKRGRFAGIVFGPWGPGNRTEFLPEAMRYAAAGAVSVLIDYPWTRPSQWRRNVYDTATSAQEDLDVLAQAVVDLRRAIDVLLARGDVDPKRIAYVGHSFGAQFGAILTAVDRRMAASILMAGTPGMAAIWLESDDPGQVEMRQRIGVDLLKKELEVTGVLDGIRFVPHAAPIPILFQFAKYERTFARKDMEAYAAAAGEPKKVLWYPTGHELNDPQALLDRAQWLSERIGLGR